MAIVFTITDAGRAALVAPDNDGTNAVTIAEIGFGTGRYTPAKDQTDLRSPIKRVDTIAGKTVANDTLHVTVQDETADAYSVGEVGLFTDAGVLFAVYSQSDWIIEKAAPATLLLATDLVIESLDVSSITFGDAAFLNPPATETVQGVVKLATQAEVDAGKDGRRAIVPRTLKAFIDKVLEAYATVRQLADHAASRDHPGATTSAQGMVELATYGEAREGKDNSRALTPAADKAALDQHRTESGAHAGDRISLDSLKTLGDPKTVQAAFAALGSAALRNEGSGGGLDADKLDGQELEVFYRSNTSNPSIRMGSGSDDNWDGIVYDESANTFSFYADQTVGTDTPRAVLGAGYLDLAGRRLTNDGTGFKITGALTLDTEGHFDEGQDYGLRIAAYEPSLMLFDKSTNSGLGALVYNGGGLYVRVDANGGDIDDVSGTSISAVFAESYMRVYGSLGVGNVTPSATFNNGSAIAMADNDSGIRGVGDGQIELWANNERQVVLTKSTVRIDNELIVSGLFTANKSDGFKLVGDLSMGNHDIIGANKVTINDEGFGEGFMLPSWEFSQQGGSAWVRDSGNSHVTVEFAPSYTRILDGLAVGTGVDTGKNFWNGKGIALGDNDSGIRQSSDGVIEIWCNNDRTVYFTPNETRSITELVTDTGRLRMGSGGSSNWDGLVYDEGSNQLQFFADQDYSSDTPRVTLGPGWIEASGHRVWHDGDAKLSKGANGYQRLPSGLLIQWGTAPSSSPTNFPIKFNAVYSVTLAGNGASNDGGFAVYDLTTSGFKPDGQDIGKEAIFYIAIGS